MLLPRLADGLASVVVPVDKLSILVTVLFSYLVFREKLSRRAWLGLAAWWRARCCCWCSPAVDFRVSICYNGKDNRRIKEMRAMRCAECFERIYGCAPAGEAFAPYRVCPIGAHVDHNLGKTMGFAIDRGVRIAYAAEESGAVEVRSLQFPAACIGAWMACRRNGWGTGRIICAAPRLRWAAALRSRGLARRD